MDLLRAVVSSILYWDSRVVPSGRGLWLSRSLTEAALPVLVFKVLCLSQIPNCMRTWSLRVLRQFLRLALSALHVLAATAPAVFKTSATLHLENLALRHQIGILHRSVKKPKLTTSDRLLWAWLSEVWSDWRSALVMVKPETVLAWHRKGFRLFWTWKVRHGQPGRPSVSKETRELIRKMSRENPLWGAPRIHGELLKLGIDIGETSVSKYRVSRRKPPSQTSGLPLTRQRSGPLSNSATPSPGPSSTPADCKLLRRGELRVWRGRSDTSSRIYDAAAERSVGGSATPQAWKTLPTVPFVSVRTT